MASTDSLLVKNGFLVKLRCPACGRRGEACLSLASGYACLRDPSTKVESISDGFKAVPGKSLAADDMDLVCSKHNAEVAWKLT
jgi:hypothetical protein